MAKKTTPKTKSKTSKIEIGGNVDQANFIQGDNNIVTLPPEYVKINSLHQLPSPLADFTGRDDLLQEILSDFETGKGATITGLTGLGGIGKTVLGLQVAHQIKDNYPDAQIFLDLKGTTTPLTALDIVRHVILSFEPSADVRGLDETNMQAVYQSILDGRKVLLYFDNTRSSEQIAKLIPPNSCALIITSRWTFPVVGLKAHKVGVLDEKEAEKFLLELCPRIADHSDELAEACGYLPLALRIASSYLQVNNNLGVEDYIKELISVKSRLETFTKSRKQAELASEPDVFATFELSYEQLSEDQQKMWRKLGVFPAPFDSNAVARMWEMDDAKDAQEVLSLLMRYSLIDFNETSNRYEVHDLLGEFARSKMQDIEKEEVYFLHASYYMQVLQNANGLYLEGGEKILAGLHLLDLDWAHIQNGQAWAVKDIEKKVNQELACEYPNAGYSILHFRLHPRLYIDWLKVGLDSAKSLNNKKYQGFHLNNLGHSYANLGEVRKAIECYEQTLVITREIGDRNVERATFYNLGNAYRDLGEVKKAIELYEQALVIAREIGDRRGEGTVLGSLGNTYSLLNEVKRAIDYYEQALVIAREIGDRHVEGVNLGNLGNVYRDLGEVQKAIEFFEQALVIYREIGDRRGEGIVLGNFGNAYRDLEEVQKAIEYYDQALVITREIGDRLNEGIWLSNLGNAYAALGEKERGVDLVKQAMKIFEAIESPNAEWARNKLKEWGAIK